MCRTPYHQICPTRPANKTDGLLLDPHQEPLRLRRAIERAELGPEMGKEEGKRKRVENGGSAGGEGYEGDAQG